MMNLDFVPISLPSKCKTYKDVDPTSIRIRPFKGRDEQLVAEMDLRNSKKNLLELLKGILQGIDPNQLTTGDLSYILVWEAINSYTNLYPQKLTCQGCYQEVDTKIDLNSLDKKELPDDFKQPFSVKLSKQEVNLRLLTLKDDIEIANFGTSGQPIYLYSFAMSIVDESISTIAKVKVLEDMNALDLGKIRGFHEEFEHGPDFNAQYTCPKCGYEGRVFLPFRLAELVLAVSRPGRSIPKKV
jgi:hypothetical protein